MKKLLITLTCLPLLSGIVGQTKNEQTYVAPKDVLVQQKLAQWQDIKFGLLMHWGTYSQWGVVESWSICPEDEGWTVRRGPYSKTYAEYKRAYENLQTTFNPTKFDPEKWAAAAKDAGMKYVVFTTKHHDGFCMFDTKETDYSITSPHTPFSANPRSNVTKEVFKAFRDKGFMIGAYFSKPDWHNEHYWWPYFPPKDRNVNYDPAKHPDQWEAFKKFTYNQIKELMTGYGSVDILWLDGGWVRPFNTIDPSVDWQKSIPYNQDIDMKNIATMARSYQPGLLVVDRTVAGEFENYTTPEQQIPTAALLQPWESCITMGNSWSYVPGDTYKPTSELIAMLVKIVSRGGNLLLNIGPSPEGDFADTAYSRLQEIGQWMKTNSESIYNTKPIAPYSSGNVYFTQSQDEKIKYATVLKEKGTTMPLKQLTIGGLQLKPNNKITLLGNRQLLKWKQQGEAIVVDIPEKVMATASSYAIVLRIE